MAAKGASSYPKGFAPKGASKGNKAASSRVGGRSSGT